MNENTIVIECLTPAEREIASYISARLFLLQNLCVIIVTFSLFSSLLVTILFNSAKLIASLRGDGQLLVLFFIWMLLWNVFSTILFLTWYRSRKKAIEESAVKSLQANPAFPEFKRKTRQAQRQYRELEQEMRGLHDLVAPKFIHGGLVPRLFAPSS